MELTKKEFVILEYLASTNEQPSQRRLEEITGFSLGTVNKIMKELSDSGYVVDSSITPEGLEALEPYRVKRALFIAAGFGSRLAPITLNTPKPLVRVNGKRIIDTLLDACVAVGIEEIYIVRGYLAEQFDQLLYKYPTIKFIENPAYNEANNISSVVCARYLLRGAYIFEADLLLKNRALIKKYQYTSNVLGIYKERSDDWCLKVKDGVILTQGIGGMDCYQEVGITYLNEADGKKYAEHIMRAYEIPGGKEQYWDQPLYSLFRDDYQIEVRPCHEEDITEIDTLSELKKIDKTYDM